MTAHTVPVTNAGTTIAISASLPATYDFAGYGAPAITYTCIGTVEDHGGHGADAIIVKSVTVDTGLVNKMRGSVNYGTKSLKIGNIAADGGQTILKAASISAAHHSIKITYADTEVHYLDVIVKSFKHEDGSADSERTIACDLEISRAPVIVSAGYATFNPAAKAAAVVLSNGNRTATCDGTSSLNSVLGTVFKTTGKRYYEITVDVLSNFGMVGIGTASMSLATGNRVGFDVYGIGYKSTATCDNDGAFPAYGTAWSQGDVLSVLVDLDTQALNFWRNGVDLGAAPFAPTVGWAYAPAVSVHEFTSLRANFGASAWTHTPPAGYTGWIE